MKKIHEVLADFQSFSGWESFSTEEKFQKIIGFLTNDYETESETVSSFEDSNFGLMVWNFIFFKSNFNKEKIIAQSYKEQRDQIKYQSKKDLIILKKTLKERKLFQEQNSELIAEIEIKDSEIISLTGQNTYWTDQDWKRGLEKKRTRTLSRNRTLKKSSSYWN